MGVDQVAAGENSRHIGAGGRLSAHDVAGIVQIDLAAYQLGARVMADGLKNAGNFELTFLAGFGVPQGDRLELRLALHGDDLAVPREGDLGVGCGTVGHDLRGA